MMKSIDSHSRQAGVALVLSLLILLVLTVVGVAAMNSTIMQERMAGNASTQADVFEMSSEGVTRSLELFNDNGAAFEFGDYNLSCGQVFGVASPDSSSDGAQAWGFPRDGSWYQPPDNVSGNTKLEQRMYCCRSWEEVDDGSGSTIWVESPSKLYALNRATFMGGADNSESLAMREIEVELAEAEPDDPTCAICSPGDVNSVTGANSKQFSVNGSCGAAIVTDSAADAGVFKGGIPQNRINNYAGGIVDDAMGEPWNRPAALAEFVFWMKLGLDLDVPGMYVDGDYSDSGTTVYGEFGNAANPPQIIYIDGDAKFGGNISGAGILIVREKLTWGGTPDFDGLIIALGGFATDGAGTGEPDGSIVITNLDYNSPPYSDDPLYGRDVLHYQVARDDAAQEVKMFTEGDYTLDQYGNSSDVRKASGTGSSGAGADEVPARPILRDSEDRELIYYNAGTPNDHSDDRFFLASDGSEAARPADPADWTVGNDFVLNDPSTGLPTVTVSYQSEPTRDAYGRMIPEFVLADNYPDDYGYNPNAWNWDPDVANGKFAWGPTDISWSGGGKGSISYDCRMLQRVKHELLCEQPLDSLPTDEDDPFYEDPDAHYDEYCWHYQTPPTNSGGSNGGEDGKYFEDYATTDGSTSVPPTSDRPENQKAWHTWKPSCDCLGISVDADMVIAGWRENLGWRDDAAFQGCSALPSP